MKRLSKDKTAIHSFNFNHQWSRTLAHASLIHIVNKQCMRNEFKADKSEHENKSNKEHKIYFDNVHTAFPLDIW